MRRTILIAVAAAMLCNVSSASAIHSTTFKANRATCGVIKGQRAMGCFSPVLPGRHSDGFIKLRPHGRAQLSERGDCPFRGCGKRPTRLRRDQGWHRFGIACHTYSFGLDCQNRDVHHFVLRRHSWARG